MSDNREDAEIPKKPEVHNLIEIVLNLKEVDVPPDASGLNDLSYHQV